MKRFIKYILLYTTSFIIIWIIGCAFVKNLLSPTINYPWVMVVGYITGIIGFTFADFITNRFIGK